LWIHERAPMTAARWYSRLMQAINSLELNPESYPLAPEADAFAVELRQMLFGKRSGILSNPFHDSWKCGARSPCPSWCSEIPRVAQGRVGLRNSLRDASQAAAGMSLEGFVALETALSPTSRGRVSTNRVGPPGISSKRMSPPS